MNRYAPQSSDHEIGVLQWPPYPVVPVLHANAFSFALNDATDECEIAFGRVTLPVGAPPESDAPGLDVDVVVRIVMTKTALHEFFRGVGAAVQVTEGETE